MTVAVAIIEGVVGVNTWVKTLRIAMAIAVSVSTVRVTVAIGVNNASCWFVLCFVAFTVTIGIEAKFVCFCITFTVIVSIKAEVVCVVVGVLGGSIPALACLEFMNCFDVFFLVIFVVSKVSEL